jgi:large conductance mechanosensitive channel
MNKQLKGFMDFVRTHGVVGLAVGLAIGTQVGKTVQDIVDGLINPIVGFIIGNTDGLAAAKWHIEAGSRQMDLGWGLILSSLVTLLAVSAVIYWVVNGLKLDKADKSKD